MNKPFLRKKYKEIRKNLPLKRLWEAFFGCAALFKKTRGQTLSYASFGSEINLWGLNKRLARTNSLILPKVVGDQLFLYQVCHIKSQLRKNKRGWLEPIPNRCKEVKATDLSVVLVPGLAFDPQGHRLGFGGGFYDRLLSLLPKKVITIAPTFKELFLQERLPTEPHDKPVMYVAPF